jgi:phage I-like protein
MHPRVALKDNENLAAGAFDEPAEGQKREAPKEFRVFHAGINKSKKGDFLFDEQAAKSVMAAFKARGPVPMMMDYEHMSTSVPPVIAPNSATDVQLEVRPDDAGGPELWALPTWTNSARKMLEEGEYRLFSPLFLTDKSTPPRVVALENITLTNLPALTELEPLVAASTQSQGDSMDPEKIKAEHEAAMKRLKEEHAEELKKLKEEHEKAIGEHKALCERAAKMDKVDAKLKKLGVSFDDWAEEESAEHEQDAGKGKEKEEEAKALTALKDAVLAITGAKDVGSAVGAVTAMATQHKELVALKATTEAAAAKALDIEFDTTLEGAVAGLKIPPALKGMFVSLKQALGTEKALVALKMAIPAEAMVLSAAPRTPVGEMPIDPDYIEAANRIGKPLAFITDFMKSQGQRV